MRWLPPKPVASSSAIQSRPRSIGRRRPRGLTRCAHIERRIKPGRTSSSAIATDLRHRMAGQWFPMQIRASAIVSANRVERLDRPHHIDLAEPLEHARIMPFRLVAFAYRSGINRCRSSRGVDFSPRPGFDNRLRLRRSDRRSRMRDPASRLHHGSLLRGPRDPAASAQKANQSLISWFCSSGLPDRLSLQRLSLVELTAPGLAAARRVVVALRVVRRAVQWKAGATISTGNI